MFAEGKLKFMLWFERLYLQWRGIGKLKYVPFLVNYLILPVSIKILGSAPGQYDEPYYFFELAFYFIPFMSVWWILMIMQEYVEGMGNEVIKIYDRQKVFDIVVYFVLYVISIQPLYKYAKLYWEADDLTMQLIISQGFFYLGISYLIIILFKSIVAAVVPIFMFTLLSGLHFSNIAERMHINDFRTVGGYVVIGGICLMLGVIMQTPVEKYVKALLRR